MNASTAFPPPREHVGPVGHHHVVAVVFVILAETMLFCGLVAGYLVLRGQAPEWPPLGQPRLPVVVTAVSTLLLVASGWQAWRLTVVVESSDVRALRRVLLRVMMLGGAFFLIQGVEWALLLSYGLTAVSSVYGACFYTIVGCHAAHVVAGLVSLGVVTRRATRTPSHLGTGTADDSLVGPLYGARLFWLFVVGIWPPLYALVYLW